MHFNNVRDCGRGHSIALFGVSEAKATFSTFLNFMNFVLFQKKFNKVQAKKTHKVRTSQHYDVTYI